MVTYTCVGDVLTANHQACNRVCQGCKNHYYHFTESLLGTWKAGVLYGENDGVKNAESYATGLKLNYSFSSGVSAFADAGWYQNKFAGVDRRIYGGLGAGYAFLDGPHNFLTGEIGVNPQISG